MDGFIQFLKSQGVIGLAIAFMLGGAANSLISSFVNDIIQPIIGLFWGSKSGLSYLHLGPIGIGHFMVAIIDFILIAVVVYFIFKKLENSKLKN